tara:strand:+ start:3243 stop:3518 length:276 start_codon:yes stop_codon:yes gene_type:complete
MFMKKSKTFSFFSIFILLVFAFNAYPQKKSKIVYKYKKFEKINLGEINVEGDLGAPGEVTISRRYLKKFKNRLPSKPNFNFEMMKGLERIR